MGSDHSSIPDIDKHIVDLSNKDPIIRLKAVASLSKFNNFKIIRRLIDVAETDRDNDVKNIALDYILSMKPFLNNLIESEPQMGKDAEILLSKIDKIINKESDKKKQRDEKLLKRGVGGRCTKCNFIETSGTWDPNKGRDFIPEISKTFYHIFKELPNKWIVFAKCTLRSAEKTFYEESKYYCPKCGVILRQQIHEYGNKLRQCFPTRIYPDPNIKKIGEDIFELGGRDLMTMVAYYTVYYVNSTSEIEHGWRGIGGWM